MFQFLGYNFLADGDALNNAPSSVNAIKSVKLTNAIFDHFNITKDISLPFDFAKPDEWTFDTIINAGFDGNLSGGNIEFAFEQISSIKIKRRRKLSQEDIAQVDELGSFDWITLYEIPVDEPEDLHFLRIDRLNANMQEYDYALVPIINGVEGNYIINSIESKFNGVFIGDAESTYKLLYDVDYGTNSRNQKIGTFEPLGKKYPIMVANGLLNYESGSVSATVIDDKFAKTGVVDARETVKKNLILKNFLSNKKPKVLKDWNGNIYLCFIVGNVETAYLKGSSMKIPHVTFNWNEIGDVNNQEDLYANGFVDVLG